MTLRHSRKSRRLLKILASGTGFIAMLAAIFFSLFQIFEGITYDSVSDLNNEFISQIDSFTETINSSIINYGMQLFYSDSVKTLMGNASFSNTDRVYMIRNLNTSLSSTDFAEGILVYNGHNGHVYSTDPSYPDQPLDELRHEPIRELLTNRRNDLRFKPIYCRESAPSGREYYVFMFYEVYPDQQPKPGTLIVTIKSDWYKKALLAAAPSSDMIVIDENGSVLVSANDALRKEYTHYYPSITPENSSGYFVNHDKGEICLYYKSASTGHTYMKISSLEKTLPRLLYFRHIVICFLITLICIFAVIFIVLLIFSLIPMLRMKDALITIEHIQTGHPSAEAPDAPPSVPLEKQIAAVVSYSERGRLEQLFYDMLAEKQEPDCGLLFKEHSGKSGTVTEGPGTESARFGLLLVSAKHRKDIYNSLRGLHPEFLATKSSQVYACIGLYTSDEDYENLYRQISGTLNCRVFVSSLFDSFDSLIQHSSNLDELRRLSFLLPETELIVHEAALEEKAPANTITSKNFTDLIVCLKSGSIEAVRAKWTELLNRIQNYRYEDFQYILNRTEDTICKILRECHPENSSRLLPESLEQLQSLDEINTAFDRAFLLICGSYSQKKAEKYSDLAARIKDIVQQEYHDSSLNSQRIADRIQMNNAYVGRLFKSSYGRSINDYINTCRIEEAMKLLKDSDLAISEIAQQVGFSNIKYFYVLFKKSTGVTPAGYRGENT